MGRSDRVLCLIVDGEPNATDKPGSGLLECFPPAVRHAVNPDRSLSQQREEPIAADARAGKDGKVDSLLKLASGLLGVGFDDLKQRDARRRRRRKTLYAVAAVAFAALLGWGAWEFKAQRVRLQNAAASMADFREAAATFDSGDSGLGMAYLARALKKDPENKAAVQRLFYELTYKNWVQTATQVVTGAGHVTSAQISPDFTKLALVQTDSRRDNPSDLVVVETLSGQTLLEIKGTPEWQPRFVSFCGNKVLAVQASVPADTGIPNAVSIIDVATGKKLNELQVEGSAANSVVSTEDGKQIFIGWGKTDPASYWNPHLHDLYGQDTENETDPSEQLDLQSGAIQSWVINGSEPLLKPTDWPVVSLCLDQRLGLILAGCIAYEKGNNAGYVEKLSTKDLQDVGEPIKVGAWVLDIQISSEDGQLVIACDDLKTRVFGKDIFTQETVLQTTIVSGRENQRVFSLGKMLGLATKTGHAQITATDGEPLYPTWDHGARFASLDANQPMNFTLVSWAGVTPLDRGGKVLLKSLLNPYDHLIPSPLEPALWWPSQSIFLSALSERANKLLILRQEPTASGFRWDLLAIDLANRAARMESAPLGAARAGSIVKSASGRYFACITSRREDQSADSKEEVLIFDTKTRTEKCRTSAPSGASALVFSADENAVIAIGNTGATVFDLNLRRIGEISLEGPSMWVSPDVSRKDSAASMLGIVETTESGKKHFLTLIDTRKARKTSTTVLPGSPNELALSGNCGAVVVSWSEGETEKCAVVDVPTGAVAREFGDHQRPKAFSYDGSRLLMSAFPNSFLYNTSNWEVIAELAGHSRMICAYAFDPRNRFVATGALDGTVRLWSLENGTQIGEEIPPLAERRSKPNKAVCIMETTESGDRLLVGFTQMAAGERKDNLGSLSVWDTGEQLATIPERSVPFVADAWFGENGNSVVVVTGDEGGRFVSFLDAALPENKVPPSVWQLAQEVSGYNVSQQITKSDDLPNADHAVSQIQSMQAAGGTESEEWLKWYLKDPNDRAISPFSRVQASEYRRALTEEMRMQRHLLEAFEMDPSDDLNLANLALLTDSWSDSEEMWKVLLGCAGEDKDILFRRAVRLFENSWYEKSEIAQDAAERLTNIVRTNLENNLSWRPREQGIARNLILSIDHDGFLNLIAHSGSPEFAKKAALMTVKNLVEAWDKDSRQEYIQSKYAQRIKAAQEVCDINVAAVYSTCTAELRRSFWLEQSAHSLGKELASCWARLVPDLFTSAILHDAGHFQSFYPVFAVQFWKFAYDCLRQVTQDLPAEQSDSFMANSGALASGIALHLIRSGHQSSDAEFFAREGLSCREEAGVIGWPLANSKSLVGAALLQQDKLDLAESFVSEGAKELLSFKETIPEGARPRLTEAVNRAALLYEKKGDQELASYWRSESEKLSEDPRFASTE
jgi:WD40 repeat protein